jgi:hypothetical protein
MDVPDEVIETIRQMRQTQKDFFKNRSSTVMLKAKNLESQVDIMLDKLPKPTPAEKKPVAPPPSLFDKI